MATEQMNTAQTDSRIRREDSRRRADHHAGARHGAVPRRHRADHHRPADLDRRRPAGGARAAADRHRPAARPRDRRARPGRSATASAPSPTSCATSPRPTARITSSARACSASASSTSCRARRSWSRASCRSPSRRRASPEIEARFLQPAAPGARGVRAAAAGAAGAGRRRSRAPPRPARWPTWRRLSWTSSREEKQEILETIDLAQRLDKVSQHPGPAARGAAPVQRDRPADQGVASTSASARRCCASRWRPSSASWARATARRPRSPS